MATKAKTRKTTKKGNKTAKVVKKVNNELVNASIAAINTAISNGEKWQELAAKLVKESESVRKEQLNMFFDTAEAVKKQANSGAKRMQKLVGIDNKMVKKAKDFATKHPVSKKVLGMAEEVSEMVTENPMVKKVEKTAAEMKAMGMAKFNDVKEDVLEQASKIMDKGEAMIKDAKKAPKAKAKKPVAKRKTPAKKVVKKTTPTKAKATITVAKVAKKATPKAKVTKKAVSKPKAKSATKVTAKKATTAAPTKQVTKTTTTRKTNSTPKVKKTDVAVKKTTTTVVNDDLKLIYGIGPKTEVLLNKNGIKTFDDVAKTDIVKFKTIFEAAGSIYANLDAKDWKKQAEVAVKGGVSELAKWVDKNRTA